MSSPLTPFGVSETVVRDQIVKGVSSEQGFLQPFQSALMERYDRVPAERRGVATSAAFAWLKAFIASPAFTTAYAKARAEHKPDDAGVTGTLDEQVQKEIRETIAKYETSKEAVAILPPPDRAKAIADIDKSIAEVRTPAYAARIRANLEIDRADKLANAAASKKTFDAKWPEEPRAYVRPFLESFLHETATLDFATPTTFVRSESGVILGFIQPGRTTLSWEELNGFMIGKAATEAARTACDAWLKELR